MVASVREMLPSFLDELELIKTAALKPTKEGVPPKELFKRMAQNAALYGPGLGLGLGAGFAIEKLVLPKLKLSPQKRRFMAAGAGILAGLATSIAMRKALQRENEPPRHSK